MKKILILILMVVFAATTMFATNWIVDSKSGKLPKNFKAKVEKAGGKLVSLMDKVGIAVVEFGTREEAEALGFTVMPDLMLNWLPSNNVQKAEHIGLDEGFYSYQWYLPLIEADKAWDEGVTGEGVRVAVVDSGIYWPHYDLYYNIDFSACATFVPGTATFIDDNGHGTHVAGIIGAADNANATIGVAPNSTLIGIKVLDSSGSGSTSWIVAGIIHAVNQNADIINLSLGSTINKNGNMPYYNGSDVAAYIKMYRKVINWAGSQGSLVVCSAGNSAEDLDHNGNFIKLPAEAGTGIVISATGPTDEIASYSNYGSSAIWVSAPGGDFENYPYDMILSTYPGGWAFMAGTSMATPVVAGVAALILSKYGKMSVGKLKNHLANTADDLGKPGKDPYHGRGRVNAYKAVTK